MWNRRFAVTHFYVKRDRRRTGIGRRLMEALATEARSKGARCLWVETPSVNLPGVNAYLALGFELCGLDQSLYDPLGAGAGETALFLSRDLAT